MVKRIIAIFLIYVCVSLAWMFLGSTVNVRTYNSDINLRDAVGQLWGTVQKQKAPVAYYQTVQETQVETAKGAETIKEIRKETINNYFPLEASKIDVDLKLEHRKKGLLWYSTYRVKFTGNYRVINNTEETRDIFVDFNFPAEGAIYDNFRFAIGGKELDKIQITSGVLNGRMNLAPGQSQTIEIAYESQGLDEWWYEFGSNVNQAKNFSLTMTTNFAEIDFPPSSISPTEKEQTATGWKLNWRSTNLLSGVQIGMVMPQKLNPGPWVSQVTYFAPVSLFLFFFLLFLFTSMKGVKIHPMNYFFLGAAFFSFHLLLSYMVDHISIHYSFLICSLVSMLLVITYMRLVVGARFALLEVGLSQFVYLVLFSYTFFFERYTGLAITVLCITTLFVLMQITGKVDWERLFSKPEQA